MGWIDAQKEKKGKMANGNVPWTGQRVKEQN
jgi:hypothetical protein